MNIYIASPFFDEKESSALSKAESILRERGFEVFSPREHEVRDGITGTHEWSMKTFMTDKEGIDRCDCLIMLYWGNYSDTGTAWECGYAYATCKPVIVVQLGDSSNLMVHEGSHTNLNCIEELKTYDFKSMPRSSYEGEMY